MIDLYRFYDEHETLLYVGISLSAAARASQHRATQPWWHEVTRMDVEHIDTDDRAEAERIEARVILAERPLHNVVHNRGSKRSAPCSLPADRPPFDEAERRGLAPKRGETIFDMDPLGEFQTAWVEAFDRKSRSFGLELELNLLEDDELVLVAEATGEPVVDRHPDDAVVASDDQSDRARAPSQAEGEDAGDEVSA